MTVERRCRARHRVEVPVYIRYRKRPFLGARAVNLSEGGMFLAVKALTLPIGTAIELEIRSLGRRWLLPAFVIHGNGQGIGVMFRDPQPGLFRALVQDDAAASIPPPAQPQGTPLRPR